MIPPAAVCNLTLVRRLSALKSLSKWIGATRQQHVAIALYSCLMIPPPGSNGYFGQSLPLGFEIEQFDSVNGFPSPDTLKCVEFAEELLYGLRSKKPN